MLTRFLARWRLRRAFADLSIRETSARLSHKAVRPIQAERRERMHKLLGAK